MEVDQGKPKQQRQNNKSGGVRCVIAPPKLKSSDMLGLTNLLARGKAELTRFEALDVGYALGQIKRGSMLYRAFPDGSQKDVDKEAANG